MEAAEHSAPEDEDERDILTTQALIVTAGPFSGRICENDDDAPMFRSEFSKSELRWMKKAGVIWRKLDLPPSEKEEFPEAEDEEVVDCEIVTFGFYLQSRGYHCIPRQFLRPATMKDLVQRYQEINQVVFQSAFARAGEERNLSDLNNLLLEQVYITNEVWSRESMAREPSEKRRVFLCHASSDKPFVRQVRNDLANAGHSVWIDEFEIKVGDSIVTKIDEATEKADALVLFISEAAMSSDWVKREWSSSLSRMLSGSSIRVLPVVIEDCSRPALLSDIKYADFRESYNSGLNELLQALNGLEVQNRKN